MQLSNKKDLLKLLEKQGFTFKKGLGQNFLIDPFVCPEMARAAAADGEGVLEIGPGAGVLTKELAATAKKVVAVEIDERLKPVLSETLAGLDNAEVVFADVMKIDLAALIAEKFSDCNGVSVCANLPYYITSPIVMMLLESRLPVNSITVMVQKEAAERLCAEVGTREAGAVSVAVSYYSSPLVLFDVPRESFMPAPNVDSAVIKLNILKNPPIEVKDEEFFFKLVKAGFALRRKTFANSVSAGLDVPKSAVVSALENAGIDCNIRAERLNMEELAKLSEILGDGI